MADAGSGRSYSPGNYLVEIGASHVAFMKKFDGLSMEADIVANDLGPDNFQSKHVANIKWTPGKITVGAGMGNGMYEWIKQSFKKAFAPQNGSVTVADFNFIPQSRLDFQMALITSVGFPKMSGDSKDAIYLDVEFQPEQVRWSKPTSTTPITGMYGVKQKAWLGCNFIFDLGGTLPCARVASIDAFTWKCAVSPDQVGVTREPTYHPAKVTTPDIKISVSMADYDPWQQAAKSWFVDGNHLAANEMQGSITLLGPDMKKEVGRIDLHNMGFKKFSKQAYESNKEGIARFDVEFYVEGIDFTLKEYDA
jgi:hypothetical protein